jgi:predicted AlkP superfamily phosphohydrolase/phosphomutase
LPNFKTLATEGSFVELQTSMPPLSPVAWSTFITGMDPGGHGIYDFIHRDPATLIPHLSMAGPVPGAGAIPVDLPVGGCDRWIFPLSGGGMKNLRHGQAFWDLLDEKGVETTVFRMPVNFPPDKHATHALSGMGTPDIRGTSGTFSFYTNRPVPGAADISGGEVYLVSVVDDVVEGRLYGPDNPFCEVKKRSSTRRSRTGERAVEYTNPELTVPFQVYLDPDEPVARFVVGDEHEFILKEGEWSDWVTVDFEAVPLLASVSSIGRFYLQQVRPDFKLYVTPLQINPSNPALPISQPEDWSAELVDQIGPYYTQELPEDTKAFTAGVFTGHDFWDQSQYVFSEADRAFDHFIEQFDKGMMFFYFSSVDQGCHMLWHYADDAHPGFMQDPKLVEGIRTIYREMDDVLGRAMRAIDDQTTLVVMSDHGFGPFYWQVNLNTWLLEKGYVVLKDPSRQGERPLFGNVDWSKTKAYALGLNGLYVNLEGRESRGIVKPEEYQALLDQLERDMLDLVDPATGEHAISLVVQSRRDFHGPYADKGPDIVVGYNAGYRSSWRSPLGEFPRSVFEDNDEPWSGDHSVDNRVVPGVLLSNRPISMDRPALYDLTVGILDEYGVAKTEEMLGHDCLGSGSNLATNVEPSGSQAAEAADRGGAGESTPTAAGEPGSGATGGSSD